MPDNRQHSLIHLRIHGDNIVECERALLLVANSFAAAAHPVESAPYLPRYQIKRGREPLFVVELLPGYGRWNVDLQETLRQYGAPLREAVDAVITRVSQDEMQEEILLALEFCSALPAGNNAWQRSGRALACAASGVPYLYFAEIGGAELGKERKVKASRFPNPIVPFSYLTASQLFDVVCVPVYAPSPSSLEATKTRFEAVFGLTDGQCLIKCLLEDHSPSNAYETLTQKALAVVEILAAQRRRRDTLQGRQWAEFLELKDAEEKAAWLEQNALAWVKKRGEKVVTTETFLRLLRVFQEHGCLSVGAVDIPICLVPHHERKTLAEKIVNLYEKPTMSDFTEWIVLSDSPLIVVWITGFKQRGDDSRPDRGLVPLTRMLFGNNVDVLAVVYGPARPAMWETLRNSPYQLVSQNGLWEAIIHLSDAVLADSVTLAEGPISLLLSRDRRCFKGKIRFTAALSTNEFSEQDVDSVLHLLFAQAGTKDVFEGMCNPPGGDWSGLSILNWQTGEEFRWTSLPRVSSVRGKRPDHVIQFRLEGEHSLLLIIESKDRASNLGPNVGARLKIYVQQLVETPPTIKKTSNRDWKLLLGDDVPPTNFTMASGGAFLWTGERDLMKSITHGQLDVAFAFEFKSGEQLTLLHIRVRTEMKFLLPKLHDLTQRFSGWLKVQIH